MKLKTFFLVGTFAMLSMVTTGCFLFEEDQIHESKQATTMEAITGNEKQIDSKSWKDLTHTNLDDENHSDLLTAKSWVMNTMLSFGTEPDEDSKLIQSGHDVYFHYYLEALGMQNVLEKFIEVEGVSLEKDFDNLRELVDLIIEGHKERTSHLNFEDYGENKGEAIKDWKEPSDKMKQSVEFTKQLLNDIFIAINRNGEGTAFGVTYQLSGDKVDELEMFIGGSDKP